MPRTSVRGVSREVLGSDPGVEWDTNGGERSKARRRIVRATAYMKGYRRFLEPGGWRRRRAARPKDGSGA